MIYVDIGDVYTIILDTGHYPDGDNDGICIYKLPMANEKHYNYFNIYVVGF